MAYNYLDSTGLTFVFGKIKSCVRFDTNAQGLTDTQKANARTNIGAGTSSFSGDYNDLSNTPTIPTVNNATLTIQKNGTDVATFTANSSSNATANITVPVYYEHNILIFKASNGYYINFKLITKNSTAITTYNDLAAALNGCGYTSNLKALICSGTYYTSATTTTIATGIFASSTTAIYCRGAIIASTSGSTSSGTMTIPVSPTANASALLGSSSFNIQDYVRNLESVDY